MRQAVLIVVGFLALLLSESLPAQAIPHMRSYPIPVGSHPHDVAPAPDGMVWYTAQQKGVLGRLDPKTGKVREVALGEGAAPHGIIIGPDRALWVTDGGLNAIVRVDPRTFAVKTYPLPRNRADENLNTATFDRHGNLWFTGQAGIYGRLNPRTGEMRIFDAPKGRGPYGMTTATDGSIYFASLAGSYIARIDPGTGHATVLQPPTPNQGARRVWADGHGRIWVSEWNAGQLAVYDPASRTWHSWKLPGPHPAAYAVYVDDQGQVWLSDWGSNAIVRFDPNTHKFTVIPLKHERADVRQLAGRHGEVWAPESGTDHLTVIQTR